MALDKFRRIDMQINRANDYQLETQFAKEGDYNGRELVVQITNAGEVINLTGVSLNLGWHHDSVGNMGLDPFTVVDVAKGIFKITYPAEMLNAGDVTATIQVIENGKITLTRNFKITVEYSPIDENVIVSENSFTTLQNALKTVNQYDGRIANLEANKVSRSEFDSRIDNLLDGSPSIFMNSLSELQTTYPNGTPGVALVNETNPAKIYIWNGNAWEDFGDYQGFVMADGSITSSKIADGTIERSKLQPEYIPFTKALSDPSKFPSKASDLAKLYIAKDSLLQTGIVNLKGKFSAGTFDFYLLKKTGLTFTVLKRVTKTVAVGGDQTIITNFYASGSGDEYIGLIGPIHYQNGDGTGVYEAANVVKDATSFTAIDSSATLNLGFYPIYYETEISNRVEELNDKINSMPTDISGPTISLSDYKTPQYSEISEPVGFVGRWFDKTINGFACKVTINQGSEFYFKVKGTTSVNINFELNSALETPYFAYSIDGSVMTRQLITNPTLPAVTTDEHIVRVVIDGITETEDKWVGEKGVAFKNVTVGASGTVTGILPKNRKIMFFGDSITEGIRVLNMNATANGNSGSGAFPFVTSENLNAISYRVGFGSQGVTNGGNGGVPEVLPMLDLMTSTRPAPYYEPDLIVLNHGTNDGPGTSEDFIAKYNAVLDRLTIKYAGVPIFAMIPFRKDRETEIRQCVAGRSNVYLVETGDWPITYTDGTHPDLNGGIVAGQKLAEFIISVVGKQFFI